MSCRGLRASAVALALTVCGVASAQDGPGPGEAPSPARIHFEAGRMHFEAGRYEQAIVEFEAAYAIEPRPALLYDLYLAHERLGQLEQAIDALQRYLPHAPDDASRAQLEERLANARARLQARRAQQAEQARARETAAPRASGGGGLHPAAVATLIGAGVLAASFVVFASLSEAEDSALGARCGTSCTRADVAALEAYNVVADVSWISALVAAAAGLVLALTLDEDAPGQDAGGAVSARIVPAFGPGGAAARAELRF